MIIKILLISIVVLLIKTLNHIPINLEIGDITFSYKLSTYVIFLTICFASIKIVYNIIFNTSAFFRKKLNSYYEYRNKLATKRLVDSVSHFLCNKNTKIIYEQNNIVHNLIMFVLQPNSQISKTLDNYTSNDIFTNILTTKSENDCGTHLQSLKKLTYDYGSSWAQEDLFKTYLKIKQYDDCMILAGKFRNKDERLAEILFTKYKETHNLSDLEEALKYDMYNLDISLEYCRKSMNQDKIRIIETIWKKKPSFKLALEYLKLLSNKYESLSNKSQTTRNIESAIANLTSHFPDSLESKLIKCYVTIMQNNYDKSHAALQDIKSIDEKSYTILLLKNEIIMNNKIQYLTDIIDNMINNIDIL